MGVTRQIQRTRVAETTTKTELTQRQSLEFVQTLLHGGLSSLSYLRNFFAEKAFDERVFEMNGAMSYADYAAGKLPTDPKRARKPQTTMQVLRRGRSKRADMFLNWLEEGAFTALKDGKLRALQVYVHADSTDRDKVIETYTFTVRYHFSMEGRKRAAGVEVGNPGKYALATAEATNSGMQNLLRDIMKLCTTLPDLPEKRYISMALYYLDDREQEYQPKGFIPSASDNLMFAQADGWEKRTEVLGDLHSPFHSTAFRVAHLYQTLLDPLAGIAEPSRIPRQLEYHVANSKTDEIGGFSPTTQSLTSAAIQPVASNDVHNMPLTSTTSPGKVSNDANTINTPAPMSGIALNGREDDDIDSAATSTPHLSAAPSASCFVDTTDTQASVVPAMRDALLEMMQPEHLTQGDTQTQAPMQPPPNRTCSSQNRSVDPSIRYPDRQNLSLLPHVVQQLDKEKSSLRQTAMRLAKPGKPRSENFDIVLCQCGHAEDEDEMIGCSFCGLWQHLHCYGFSGAADPRLPDQHACYQCLLGGKDDGALTALHGVVLQRRAMHFALRDGLRRKGDLAMCLSISVKTAESILKYLRGEKFIVETSLSHKPGFAATGKPMFVPSMEGSSYAKMLETLFNPLLHVERYYAEPVIHSAAIAKQVIALRAESMPPPATPYSGGRKKTATPTTTSDLDLRASITPYHTPVRTRSQQIKRSRDEDDSFNEPAAKRPASDTSIVLRLRSVQTRFMLNADGLSSSPMPP